jgi:spore germination protein GerM
MQENLPDKKSHRPISLAIALGLSLVIVGAGSAAAIWNWNSLVQKLPFPMLGQQSQPKPVPQAPTQSGETVAPIAPPQTNAEKAAPKVPLSPSEKTLQVYWLKGSGSKIELVAKPVKLSSAGNSTALMEAAVRQLLAGPNDISITTTIPKDTHLGSVSVRSDGIHVDLSKEFASGGGSSSMTARVAQVLYTVTSLDPTAQVWLSIEGKPLEVLGGEGLMLDQPMTRKGFEQDFSL